MVIRKRAGEGENEEDIEIERRRSGRRNDGFWGKDDEKEGEREGNARRALSPLGRRYKGETVSQFTNPDFRSRTSIRVFTLTASISFLSISLLRDRRKGRLASPTRRLAADDSRFGVLEVFFWETHIRISSTTAIVRIAKYIAFTKCISFKSNVNTVFLGNQ